MKDLFCPRTGRKLIYVGHEKHCYDPIHYYHAESEPSIKYERHPFQWNIFRSVESTQIFKLNNDNSWTELILVGGEFIPRDSPKRIIKWFKFKAWFGKIRWRIWYFWNYKFLRKKPLFDFQKVAASTIMTDLVEVEPMNKSIGILYYGNNYKYEEKK